MATQLYVGLAILKLSGATRRGLYTRTAEAPHNGQEREGAGKGSLR
jgi:hypothetical protein